MCTINANIASDLLEFMESATPAWPKIRIEGRERTQPESSGNTAAWGPYEVIQRTALYRNATKEKSFEAQLSFKR